MKNVRQDFPLLNNNPKLIYLDSAATSLKPQSVLDAMNDYYTQYGANIHRGLYGISERATADYEETRNIVADFINAPSPSEIIFTRNTTESLNLLAYTLGDSVIDEGDEIVTTILEHHSNFVPWQQLAERKQAQVRVIDCTDNGDLDIYTVNERVDLEGIVTDRSWIMSIQLASNVLGTIQPIKEIIHAARKKNPHIMIIVDAAQAVAHIPIDVQDLDCDFLVFSAHKMYGPTGVGVLWGRSKFLDAMPPFLTGGDMVQEVALEVTSFQESPHRFEAGTPDIAGVIGLKAAVRYLQKCFADGLVEHEQSLLDDLQRLVKQACPDITILAEQSRNSRLPLVSYSLPHAHPHDLATILDEQGVAVRAGHHCAMPLHTRFGLAASLRVSCSMHTQKSDITKFVKALQGGYSILCPSIKK